MGCPTNIVPGFTEAQKAVNRTPGAKSLEMKVDQGLNKNESNPDMQRRKAKPDEEQTVTLYRGEGKNRMARDPANQFAEKGSANLEFWDVDSSSAESYGTVRKKSFTFIENDMFDISPKSTTYPRPGRVDTGDNIEQGWMDLLKGEKHTKFPSNNPSRKVWMDSLSELDKSRDNGKLNNSYRGVNLFYKDGGITAVNILRDMGYKGITMVSPKGTKIYAFFSKQKKKAVPKNKPRTWLKYGEFWVEGTDKDGNRTRTIHYEQTDGTHNAISGTTQRY
jgi:hypothetical protein